MSTSIKQKIPSIDFILNHNSIKEITDIKTHSEKKMLIKKFIADYKERNGIEINSKDHLIEEIKKYLIDQVKPKLKKVINATGILLHTNLGRAPIGEYLVQKCLPVITRYSNLEYNCETAKRGDRNSHLRSIIKLLTSAEDCLVVNNNAAAIYLCLSQFAKDKEVIISRSELIEIGGSFRIPDILRSAGAILKEVGTTNCTRIEDYKQNVNDNTALIFKAHQSNYFISGHTETTSIDALSDLAKEKSIPMIYDLGSGLIKKIDELNLIDEMSVKDSIESGCDLVTFSTDKLLGGPQAGVIVGRSDLIQALAKNPLMRVLRVDKLTISILYECLLMYLNEEKMKSEIPFFRFISRSNEQLKKTAKSIVSALRKNNIDAKIINDIGRTGGGTLPSLTIDSYSVQLNLETQISESLYMALLNDDCPVAAQLREGKLSFNVLSLFEDDVKIIVSKINQKLNQIRKF